MAALGGSKTANAWPPTYGPEFVFRNHAMFLELTSSVLLELANPLINKKESYYRGKASLAGFDRVHRHYQTLFADRHDVEILAKDVSYKTGEFEITVHYKDLDWYFKVSMDPGVLEVQAKPETLKRWRELEPLIQRDLFDVMAELGFTPPKIVTSGGHINIGVSEAFGTDTKHLRNFFVDFANHPELASGAFLDDRFNAPALNAHWRKRRALKRVLGKIDPKIHQTSIPAFIESVNEIVYSKRYESGFFGVHTEGPKFQALALHDERLEIRSVRAQKSAKEYIQYLDFFERWIEKLKNADSLIPYDDLSTPRNALDSSRRYYKLVKKLNLDWTEYRKLLPKTWQIYEHSGNGWTLSYKACSQLLKPN